MLRPAFRDRRGGGILVIDGALTGNEEPRLLRCNPRLDQENPEVCGS
jgi:hypothetical protein